MMSLRPSLDAALSWVGARRPRELGDRQARDGGAAWCRELSVVGAHRERAIADFVRCARSMRAVLEDDERRQAAGGVSMGTINEEKPAPSVRLTISPGAASTRIEGAIDFDVMLAIGARSVDGEITLASDRVNGGLAPVGDTLDAWASPALVAAIAELPREQARAVIDALASRTDGEVSP